MDGPHIRFPLALRDTLSVTTDAAPVRVIGPDSARRQRF
jgi:hypothetical protein